MWIPQWTSTTHEHFITDEEWASLPLLNKKGEETRKWMEAGLIGGDCGSSECLSWFYAYSEGPNKLHVIDDIWAIEKGTWANFAMQAAGSGTWCIDIGPNWEVQYTCVGGVGFSKYETALEVGEEAAESQQPGNAAKSAVNYTAVSTGEHRTWKTGHPYNVALRCVGADLTVAENIMETSTTGLTRAAAKAEGHLGARGHLGSSGHGRHLLR